MSTLTTAHVLDALADESRRRILMLLREHDLCVCEIVHATQLPQPTVSRHLMMLRNRGIVAPRKDGRYSFYRVNPDLPDWALHLIDAFRDGATNEAPYRRDRGKLTLIAERTTG